MSAGLNLLILFNGQIADNDPDGGYRRFIRQIPEHDASVKLAEFGDGSNQSAYPFRYHTKLEDVISACGMTNPIIMHCTPWSIQGVQEDTSGILVANLDKYSGRKWIDIEDSQDIEYIFPYMGLFTGVLFRYDAYTISDILKPKFPNHSYYHLPHSLSPEIFKDWELTKPYDVTFISARDSIQCYPFRWRVFNILRSAGKFRIQYLNSAKNCNQAAYSQALNLSWLCMSTPTIYKHETDNRFTGYFFRKFVEIPMSASIVLGYLPAVAESEFGNCYVKISETMSDDEIVTTVTAALSDKDALGNMSKELQSKFSRKYSYKQNFEDMKAALLYDIGPSRAL
jgi:hypothetical protein